MELAAWKWSWPHVLQVSSGSTPAITRWMPMREATLRSWSELQHTMHECCEKNGQWRDDTTEGAIKRGRGREREREEKGKRKHKQTDRSTYRLTDTDRNTDTNTNTNRQVKQTDKQTDRQTWRQWLGETGGGRGR